MSKETKSPGMVKFLDEVTQKQFGRKRSTSIDSGMCVTCGKAADTFKDALSRREYGISGMCQICQDEVFKDPEDDDSSEYNPEDDKGNDPVDFKGDDEIPF